MTRRTMTILVTVAALGLSLSACAPQRPAPVYEEVGEPVNEESPSATPTTSAAADLAVAATATTRLTNYSGFVADVSISWTEAVRIEAGDIDSTVPACASAVTTSLASQSAEAASVYAYRVFGSISYPAAGGFQWSDGGVEISIVTRSAHNSRQTLVCGPETFVPGAGAVLAEAPAGGEFELWVARVVPKTPNNPDGTMQDVLGVAPEDYFNSEIRATSSDLRPVTCSTTCLWDTALALP